MSEQKIDAAKAFSRGTTLEVTAKTSKGSRTFRTTVQYMDLRNMWIGAPKDDHLEGVTSGTDLRIIAEKEGYRYETSVQLNELIRKPEALWRVVRPVGIDRKRGRAMVRQDVRLPNSILRVDKKGREDLAGVDFNINVVDLSTGGGQFESPIEVLEGPGLSHTLILDLPHRAPGDLLEVEVFLIDNTIVESSDEDVRLYRAKFRDPSRNINMEVTRHLFLLQLEGRKAVKDPHSSIREDPIPKDQAMASIRTGSKVTMECFSPQGELEKWISNIQYTSGDEIAVLAPMYRGGSVAIDPSREIRLLVFSPRINALVVARTKRIGIIKEPISIWQLSMPGQFYRRHQRSHVRMDVNIDGSLHIFDSNAKPPVDVTFAVTLNDISGGGAAFKVPQRMPSTPDATLELSFELPSSRMPFGLRVTLVGDVEQHRLADRLLYGYKCQFMNISERRQDEVTRYIFSEQLERRKKGMA